MTEIARTAVATREHTDGLSVTVYRYDGGAYACDFIHQPHPRVDPSHQTLEDAQAYADKKVSNSGHICGDACSPWRALQSQP